MQRTLPCLGLVLLCLACSGGPTELVPGVFAVPGGELAGTEAVAESWSAAAGEHRVLDLETRPADPYSVRVGFVQRGERIYVDPSSGKNWLQNLEADPKVRVRLGEMIYRARAVRVTDPAELEGFDPERHIFRLELSD